MTLGRVYQQDIERDREFVHNIFSNAPEPFAYQYFLLYLLSVFYSFLYLTFCDYQENKPITISSLASNLLYGCGATVLVTPILTCVTFILMLIFSLPLTAFLSTSPFAFLLCCFLLYFDNVYHRKRYLKERQRYQRTSPPRTASVQTPINPTVPQAVLRDLPKLTTSQTAAALSPAEQAPVSASLPEGSAPQTSVGASSPESPAPQASVEVTLPEQDAPASPLRPHRTSRTRRLPRRDRRTIPTCQHMHRRVHRTIIQAAMSLPSTSASPISTGSPASAESYSEQRTPPPPTASTPAEPTAPQETVIVLPAEQNAPLKTAEAPPVEPTTPQTAVEPSESPSLQTPSEQSAAKPALWSFTNLCLLIPALFVLCFLRLAYLLFGISLVLFVMTGAAYFTHRTVGNATDIFLGGIFLILAIAIPWTIKKYK